MSNSMRRAIVGGSVGTILEWFDFACYSYFAATLGKVFFPSYNPTVSLLSSFAAFGVAFFMRPIGGILFGSIGDRLGRKSSFTWSIILMSLFTFLIGFLPTFHSIGVGAPTLLVLLRLLQALCAGAELTGAYTYVGEYASEKRRGYENSWTEAGAITGFLGGSLLAFILSLFVPETTMLQWGWRIPFLLAGPLGLIGLYIRRRIDDSPAFEDIRSKGLVSRSPIAESMRRSRGSLVRAFSIAIFQNIGIYIVLSYLPTYLSSTLHFSHTMSTVSSVISIIIAIVFMPISGAWSDRFGRRQVLGWSCGITLALVYPMFLLMNQHNIALAIVAQIITSALVGIFLGPIPATMTELFPTNVRYGGMSLAYNLSVAIFGGLAPFIATYLIDVTHNPLSPAFYVIGGAILTLITILTMKETSNTELKAHSNPIHNGLGEFSEV